MLYIPDESTTQDWKIIVAEEGNPCSTEADILSFSFPEKASLANIAGDQVTIWVINGTDRSDLTPTFTLSPGATAIPACGIAGDFSNEEFIQVTAEDGTTQKSWSETETEACHILNQ